MCGGGVFPKFKKLFVGVKGPGARGISIRLMRGLCFSYVRSRQL